MQWRINKTAGYNINYIWAFAQPQSIKKTQIVGWFSSKPLPDPLNIYFDRLKAEFADNIFTLKITNAKYNDSGNYSVEVLVKRGEHRVGVTDVATVKVHGMFFSYCQ